MAAPSVASVGTRLTGSSSTTAAVPVPSGVVSGQFVVVALFIDSATPTITAPDGTWSLPTGSPVTKSTGSGQHRLYVWGHMASGNEAGTYTFTTSSGQWREGVAVRISGVASSSMWDVTNTATSTGTTCGPVSITTTVADTLMLFIGSCWANRSFTPPTGFSEHFDMIGSAGGTDSGIEVASLAKSAAGSSGSLSATVSGSDNMCAFIGALKPSAAAAAVKPLNINQAVKRAAYY